MKTKLLLLAKTSAILFILFISLFALDGGSITGVLIHLIPSYFLIAILVLAWKKPIWGGLYSALGIAFTFAFKTYQDPITFLLISGIPILIGLLFLASAKFTPKK